MDNKTKKIYIVYRKTETLQKTKSGQQIFFLKCPALRLPKDAPILISKREREREKGDVGFWLKFLLVGAS